MNLGLASVPKQLVLIVFELLSLFLYIGYIYSAKFLRLFLARSLKSLDGEVILITGTGNGIGRQLALQLVDAAPKAKLVCWDVEVKSNEQTVADMKRKNPNVEAYTYQVDISSREAVSRASEKVRDEIGHVTVIINNAGICPTGPFLLQKPESIEKTFEVNLFAHFWILMEFLPQMIRTNHGHIITTASISSALPCRDIAAYSASKHAVHGFIDALKRELRVHPARPNNIHFTTVYPVVVQTRISDPVVMRPRFPIIFPPHITAEYVARKAIEGFRQNYEYIYAPPSSQILALASHLLPFEIQQKAEDGLFGCEVEHLLLDQNDVKEYRSITSNGDAQNGKKNH